MNYILSSKFVGSDQRPKYKLNWTFCLIKKRQIIGRLLCHRQRIIQNEADVHYKYLKIKLLTINKVDFV